MVMSRSYKRQPYPMVLVMQEDLPTMDNRPIIVAEMPECNGYNIQSPIPHEWKQERETKGKALEKAKGANNTFKTHP